MNSAWSVSQGIKEVRLPLTRCYLVLPLWWLTPVELASIENRVSWGEVTSPLPKCFFFNSVNLYLHWLPKKALELVKEEIDFNPLLGKEKLDSYIPPPHKRFCAKLNAMTLANKLIWLSTLIANMLN